MLIAIISDSHDNITNIEKFLSWAKENKIETIIHCGDIASPETIDYLSKNFSGVIHFAFGNMDNNYRSAILTMKNIWTNVELHGNIGTTVIPAEAGISSKIHEIPGQARDDIRIAFCHFPDQAKELASSGNYNLVFYGHTHKPWMETLPNNCQLINPGTLGGIFSKATFAIYDTISKKLELKILEQL
ncbi:MAG: YfcE family phosphodiesterase [bacterium]